MTRPVDMIELPHRGWGRASVPVDHAPPGVATVMEIQGNWLSSYYVYGLVDTPDTLEQGLMLCTQNHSRQRLRAVVPREYTHVKISMGTGKIALLTRWRLGFRPADTCPELLTAAQGRHPDVLLYNGPATAATFEVLGRGYAQLHRFAVDGTGKQELRTVGLGPFRGGVELPPGPILVEVDCLTSWSLTLKG
ncbi:hypothetical protein [Actinophytocola xanthii]|uniref:Uncharacterized protein n=1 Tax=Actinophytocola xanthii TaxID=1912961 RepID=A0A1Q8CRP7_9PSEU|nr:hypothetical protein [Actinophytocola xanthii]OLF17030.1 hypothetical protein BU204_13070 [Actinophytocola xanthii]